MTKDLTSGSPMRLILGFTVPTLLGLLFQQLYNMVDAMIVGKLLGSQALGAVGSTGSLILQAHLLAYPGVEVRQLAVLLAEEDPLIPVIDRPQVQRPASAPLHCLKGPVERSFDLQLRIGPAVDVPQAGRI